MRGLLLRSDFRDYYDHQFDGATGRDARPNDTIFERMAKGGPGRTAMFGILDGMGLHTPPRYRDRAMMARSRRPYVAYTDERAHRGEGKVLVMPGEPVPDGTTLAVAFLGDLGSRPTSVRLLRIGSRHFWLRYTSDDPWRSNVGEVVIETLATAPPNVGWVAWSVQQWPLLAIDFVGSRSLGWTAIDLNTAPAVGGTPVEDILRPAEVVAAIRQWYEGRGL